MIVHRIKADDVRTNWWYNSIRLQSSRGNYLKNILCLRHYHFCKVIEVSSALFFSFERQFRTKNNLFEFLWMIGSIKLNLNVKSVSKHILWMGMTMLQIFNVMGDNNTQCRLNKSLRLFLKIWNLRNERNLKFGCW